MRPTAVLAIVAVLAVTAPAVAHAGTDEDGVRAVLDGMNGAYNRSDFGGFAAHLCADMTRADGFEAGWYSSRQTDGATRITVNSVDVTGDDAVAIVRFDAANREDAKTLAIDLQREGTDWKACRYDAGMPV